MAVVNVDIIGSLQADLLSPQVIDGRHPHSST